MAASKFTIPEAARDALTDRGYDPDSSMSGYIELWWEWYTRNAESGAVHDFYSVPYKVSQPMDDGGTNTVMKSRQRLSLDPAARACQEWASLMLNEDTVISAEQPNANKWIAEWAEENDFWPTGQQMVERAFATGTGAWALAPEIAERDEDTRMRLRSYDARMIVPLTWDDEGVTECAFCSVVHVDGKRMDQLQVHAVGDSGTYAVETLLFDDEGAAVNPEDHGMIATWESGCPTPTFGIVKPAIGNALVDSSPYGMSVFHRALGGAVQSVDIAFDAMMQEVQLTEAMVFMDESMVDVRSSNGKFVPVPLGAGDRKFVTLASDGSKGLYEVYSPDIRTEPLRGALEVALAEYGDQCGFGKDYFALDKVGGLRTATEVSADNSALMRNIRKHENELRRAIQRVASALLTCARIHCGADIEEDFGAVSVQFDDSIITDTQAEKTMMLNEIAAGVVPKWKYLVEFYGMSAEDAKAETGAEVVDGGF